jgi:Zn-dependent M28 family amino/carboxypeptidase
VEPTSEVVIYSAHWDQLGIGAEVDGDGIYNGALDNATGTAVLLELARAWASLKTRPERSAVFLAVTAGEAGLLGSKYYIEHPAVPLGKTAVAINFDTFQPFGIPESLNPVGAHDTSVLQQVQDAGRRLGLRIQASNGPGIGTCCRSDHDPFARVGVPAFSVQMASGFAGKDAARVEALRTKNDYDQPNDEYREEWDFSGLALVGEYGFLLGRMIAELDDLPSWNKDSPYYRPR